MLLVSAAILALSAPTDSTLIREFSALLQAAPIERLKSHTASLVVTQVIVADLDADGSTEAVVSVRPSLRQTPTLLVFRRAADGSWERNREGLAPGRLRAVSGRFVDTHVHRVGIDMTAGDGSAESNQRVLNAGASRGMSLVAFRGFLHADMRIGAALVVDLSEWPLPAGTTNTCENFEFSQPEGIAAGKLQGGGETPFLVALTEDDITIYRVASIATDGRLALRSWLLPRPTGTTSLTRGADGGILLVQGERTTALRAP